MALQWFRMPRDVVFGTGTLEYLKQVKGSKAFISVGKGSMKTNGILDQAISYLKEAGIESTVFDGVESDPSIDTVYRGTEKMKEFEPDLIIGLGGCSAIDAAKAMWVFYEYPNLKFNDIKDPFTIPELRKKAKFIAIPSTSGTGTEVTCVAVITDNQTGIKYPLASYEITPDIAIVDPEICKTMPPNVTADTGMDALSHSFEAYVSTMSSAYTDLFAIESIKMISEWLPKAYANSENIEARTKMHVAQNFAGLAFSNAILGLVHSMSHKCNTKVQISHGRCNAILMPPVIQYNAKIAGARYAEIAKSLGLAGSNDQELVTSLVETIRKMNTSFGIPANLKEAGLSEAQFSAELQSTSEAALGDPCTGMNPRKASVEDIMEIYKAAYFGTDVTI